MSEQHVFGAICAVQKELSQTGVAKNGKNTQQGFKFRAWDDVQQALSPILAKHQLFVVPRIIKRECTVRETKSGAANYHVILEGEVLFVSGHDGSMFAYPCIGESMDMGDKATSKAITMLMKYGLLHGLQIPLEGTHDGDSDTPQETVAQAQITPTAGVWEAQGVEEQQFLIGIAAEANHRLAEGRPSDALDYIKEQKLTADETDALWTRFDSKQRAAMKKAASPKPTQETH